MTAPMDMELAEEHHYPIFREEPVAFVRECVEEAEQRKFELTAPIEEMPDAAAVLEQEPLPASDKKQSAENSVPEKAQNRNR